MAHHVAPGVLDLRRTAARFEWPRSAVLGLGLALLAYLCWRIVMPFLPAFCWALALAIIAQPLQNWLLRKSVPRSVAALMVILLVLATLIAPGALLIRALAAEARDAATRLAAAAGSANLRAALEHTKIIGPVLLWLDSRYDLPQETLQVARSAAGWASSTLSGLLRGSVWLLSQIGITLFAIFYFLRDQEVLLSTLRGLIPLPVEQVDRVFGRIALTIRVSLGGKMIVASIQGALGGAIFSWLGLPAPVFWGLVMAILSMFPVLGAFLIWIPAAVGFAIQGDWFHALLLTGWGVLVIHPVDNLLGPVLVGAALRLHTLLMFISIVGGIAAFGPSGVVLGPIIIVAAASAAETRSAG